MAKSNNLTKKTNAEILSAISESASPALKTAIGDLSDTSVYGMMRIYDNISAIDDLKNEFMNLLNLVGMTYIVNRDSWDNPLAVFIKDMDVYGSDAGVIALNLAEKQSFRPVTDPNNLGQQFKTAVPDAKEQFFSINKQWVFETSFSDVETKKAFLNERGLGSLIATQMTKLFDSAKNSEFLEIIETMKKAYMYNQVLQVKVDDPTASATNASAFIKKVRSLVRKFTFYSSEYNKAEMDAHVPLQDIYLVITADIEASVDVDVLAVAFNMEKAEFLGHVIVVPDFGDLPIQAMVCGRDALVVIRTFFETRWNADARSAMRNVFLHDQLIMGFCSFVDAVALTTADIYDSGVSAVTIEASGSASTIGLGKTLQFTATVTGDSGNGAYWQVTGNHRDGTYIDEKGVLHCDVDEPVGAKLYVKAYASKNVEVSSTPTTITVAAS